MDKLFYTLEIRTHITHFTDMFLANIVYYSLATRLMNILYLSYLNLKAN